MPRLRLGVALLLPTSVAAEVDGLRRACGDASLGRVPAHLTLVPPVNVREDALSTALAVLRRAAGDTAPFALSLGPPATFAPDTPVLYLAVGGEVAALQSLRTAVFVPPLARPLTWPFVPHVTLAEELAPQRLAAAVFALADFEATVSCEDVHLLQEHRDEDGVRRWRPVAGIALGASRTVGRGGLPVELVVEVVLDPEATAFAVGEWPGWEAATGVRQPHERPLAVVARRQGEVVGVVSARARGDEAELSGLIVGAAQRGTGVGSLLVRAVEDVAREAGCHHLVAEGRTADPGLAFLASRGWHPDLDRPVGGANGGWVRVRRQLR